jgi:DNA repair exonuclease SbcCD ATPase subunit
MKVWLDKKSTLPVAGKTVRYGNSFDEKKISPELLKKYLDEGKAGDKVATQGDVEKLADKRVTDLKKQYEEQLTAIKAGHKVQIEKLTAQLEGKGVDESGNSGEIEKLKTSLTEKDGEIEKLKTSLTEKDGEIEKLNSEGLSSEIQAKLDKYDALVEDLKKCEKVGQFRDVVEGLDGGDDENA